MRPHLLANEPINIRCKPHSPELIDRNRDSIPRFEIADLTGHLFQFAGLEGGALGAWWE